MVGATGVGKTSLVRRYVQSVFSERYHSTIGVKVDKKVVEIDGNEITLILWDLAGMEELSSLPAAYLRGAAGYLLVIDGTRPQTLTTAEQLQRHVAVATGDAPFLVLLNKSDLAAAWRLPDPELTLAERSWQGSATSAKTGSGVEPAFYELARRTLHTSER